MQLQSIQNKIFEIRGQKVMLDFDLAELYEVETRALKQAVKRNIDIFPEDFMFELSKSEWKEVITNCDNLPETIKFSPSNPFAFTEHGVTMLSNVLRSKKARKTSIAIVRAFISLKKYILDFNDLNEKHEALEKKFDRNFKNVNEAIDYLLKKDTRATEQKDRKRIGFK